MSSPRTNKFRFLCGVPLENDNHVTQALTSDLIRDVLMSNLHELKIMGLIPLVRIHDGSDGKYYGILKMKYNKNVEIETRKSGESNFDVLNFSSELAGHNMPCVVKLRKKDYDIICPVVRVGQFSLIINSSMDKLVRA